MRITHSQKSQGRLYPRQFTQQRCRRGIMMLWSVWVFLAMLMIVACFLNVMWLSGVRAEARRHAESSVIVGGHAYLSDDLLRTRQQPFEHDGRVVRCRNAVVDYLRHVGNPSLVPMISQNDVELIQPLSAIQPGNAGSLPADSMPDQIRVEFGKDHGDDQLRMFFSGLTNVRSARLGVWAAARIEHTPVAFLPGGNVTIPVLPFAILDQSPAAGSIVNAGGLWAQQIESGRGFDRLSWDPEHHVVHDGPDGLPEITLVLSPGSTGTAPDSFVPLRFAAASPADPSSRAMNWLQNGVTADNLNTLGLNQLEFPSTLLSTTLSRLECAEIAGWLQSHTGQSFIVCLCHPAISPAGSGDPSTAGGVLSVQLNRPVAARIMACGISPGGDVRIRLQPCVLITSTAVMSSSPQAARNRYVYSVRLCN